MKITHAGTPKHLLELPMDILLEIFSYVYPTDLHTLARISKKVRNCLMNKKSKYIWRATFMNVDPPLPDTPEGMSEPAFAKMVFCEGCKKPVEMFSLTFLSSVLELYRFIYQWVQGEVQEKEIKDSYTKVLDIFKTIVLAFSKYRIDMQNSLSTSADLRTVLEEFLAQGASMANLQHYLPQVGMIVQKVLGDMKKGHERYELVHRENWQKQLGRHAWTPKQIYPSNPPNPSTAPEQAITS
ncbi:hypothetical protein CPB83DRAFT_860123 [Crepidotus variabilis]|uniref:F-box domain-containing protein n=1 Tax=Crepidotus variabilis TaxID=179855 RepID=A0A9P6E9W7_9AGAR|nr:hypothetical protein CPB83DRAFT_860123 [Crepidotus variabilis]